VMITEFFQIVSVLKDFILTKIKTVNNVVPTVLHALQLQNVTHVNSTEEVKLAGNFISYQYKQNLYFLLDVQFRMDFMRMQIKYANYARVIALLVQEVV
jgi:hypothetical protein